MIRTKEYCDRCEQEFGEEHPDALILPEKGRPGFPQLIWTYFRKGLQCLKDSQNQEPQIQENYLGNVNKLEFCERHGLEFNVLLKAYGLGDYRIKKILDELVDEDAIKWQKRGSESQKEYQVAMEKWIVHKKKSKKQILEALVDNGNRKHP